MEWLSWLLLEEYRALVAVLFGVDFVLLVYWRLALSILLLSVQALVVTRREHAQRLLAGIEQDLVAGRTQALAAALAPSFSAGGLGPGEFVAAVRGVLERVRVRAVNCSELRVRESRPGDFIVAAAYQGDVDTGDFGGWVRTRWDITLVQTEVGWRIQGIEPKYIDGLPRPDWDEIFRH
jgi:hypothetical protein